MVILIIGANISINIVITVVNIIGGLYFHIIEVMVFNRQYLQQHVRQEGMRRTRYDYGRGHYVGIM